MRIFILFLNKIMKEKYFYMLRVNSLNKIYTFAVKSAIQLNHVEVIDLAKKQNRFQNENDNDCVDYIEEISEFDYCSMR